MPANATKKANFRYTGDFSFRLSEKTKRNPF